MALPASTRLSANTSRSRSRTRSRSSTPARLSTGPTLPTKSSPPCAGCRRSKRLRAVPGRHRSAAPGGARIARRHAALHASGRGLRARRGRPAASSSPRRPRRARRSATTCRCSIAILKNPSTRALYLFPTKALAQDQMAELHELAEPIGEVGGDAHRRAHLRRRHAAGRAPHHPHARAHRAQQSRHAALGHPAAPSALGEAVREPATSSSSTSCTPIAACSAAT